MKFKKIETLHYVMIKGWVHDFSLAEANYMSIIVILLM